MTEHEKALRVMLSLLQYTEREARLLEEPAPEIVERIRLACESVERALALELGRDGPPPPQALASPSYKH